MSGIRMYSAKKPTHWFWRTNLTREDILKRLEDARIAGDWLVCPLGEADIAITVDSFVSDPDAFGVNHSLPTTGAEAPQSEPATRIPRRHDLDALRAFAMLLGIVIHGVIAYIPMSEVAYPIQDIRQDRTYAIFMAAIHGFRMPLFFLISGFFTAMLWRKRGLTALLKQRYRRIVLPLLLSMFTLMPILVIVGAMATESSKAARSQTEPNLWTALTHNETEDVRRRLTDGASLNEQEPMFGATALSMAAYHGNVDAIEILISRGADVNARDRDGSTPLHVAAMWGKTEAARILIENGVDLNAKNRLGETPADMLRTKDVRMFIEAVLRNDEVGDLSGRQEIALALRQAEGGERSFAPHREFKEGMVYYATLLFMLFPLFGHLWFLWMLCWLVAAFAMYAKATENLKWKPPACWITSPFCYAWLIPLTMIPQSTMGQFIPAFGPDTSVGLLPMPPVLLYYAIFFFFGALQFDCAEADARVGRRWRLTLPAALLLVFPLGYELTTGEWDLSANSLLDSGWCRPLSVFLQVAYVWLMSFSLMGMFREMFSKENKRMRYISDSSYWLYLAHLPVIIGIQGIMCGWQIPSFVKLTLALTLTTALLLAIYHLGVRYTPIGAMLNGPRQRPGKIPETKPADA
ncbi:acyltransferase family protein [Verrucomicrobia bacterium]|jgi:fucose 4-O-acetylase-like acetyltransferase|nr:acyltransferase family protein [Verrucomicrobiota bacterium]